MPTEVIVIIVVAVVVIALLLLLLPRIREHNAERQLGQQRQQEADRLRESAADRQAKADLAEREANLARAEAEEQEARARLQERGLADDDLPDPDAPPGESAGR